MTGLNEIATSKIVSDKIAWDKALFAPRRVALVGASATPGKLGYLFMQNLTAPESGFRGEVVAIHPKLTEILDRPAYANISAVPGGIDLAVIVAPPSEIPAIIGDCSAGRVPVAIIISGGFAETGEVGRMLEQRIVATARTGGVRLIGPNCFGVISASAGLNASLGIGMPARGGIALYTQSGAYGMAAFTQSQENLIGFSRVVACGNKADLDETDVLQVFGEDPETRVIAMLLESIGDGRRFFEAAREIAQRKPIVVLKTGRGEAGRRAAASHTAALATDTAITLSALRQAGIRVVDDGLTLLDLAAALDRQPPLIGRRIAIISNSGGTGVEIADLLETRGLQVPKLSEPLQGAIRPVLPAYGSAANPIDVTTEWRRFPEMYGSSLAALIDSDEVDAVVPVLLQRSALMSEVTDRVIAEVTAARARGSRKPVHVCWVGSEAAENNRRRLLTAGIPCHLWPARTAQVLALSAAVGGSQPRSANARRVARPPIGSDGGWLSSDLAFALLADAGLPVVPWRLAGSRTEAVAAAETLGMPIVLKAEREGLLHKSDSGGVRLGLITAAAVGEAYDDVANRLGTTTVLLQRQARPGVELVLGARRDATFGPVVMAGLGGIWVEALGDVALRLAPFDEVEALAMLDELKGRALLTGSRGRPATDRIALASLIARLSQWIAAAPWLEELDANPVIANADGFFVVDVRMRVSALSDDVRVPSSRGGETPS
jgi:acyl-CoA synthetase (NDP forming)